MKQDKHQIDDPANQKEPLKEPLTNQASLTVWGVTASISGERRFVENILYKLTVPVAAVLVCGLFLWWFLY